MKSGVVLAAILWLAALGVAAPTVAMANSETSEGEPRLIITIVCSIYADRLGDVLADIESATGINLGLQDFDCEINMEYAAGAPLPSVEVAIPEGALYPTCEATDDCFDPHTITVKAGTGVTWTNHDNVLHTVTGSQPNPDGMFDRWLQPGDEFTFTFETPGTYEYGCVVHPWASGVVVVESETTTEPSNPELAQDLVDELIAQYREDGVDTFEAITELDPDKVVVGFIVDAVNYTVIAHNSNPDFRGLLVEPLLDKASIPLETMLQIIMEEDEGVWLSYPLPDTAGNIIGYERGWFKMYDDYIFGARYSVTTEERIQGIVEEMTRQYDRDPAGAFDTINSFMSSDPSYPFVLDLNSTTVVAHGANPDRVDTISVTLTNSTVSLETFRDLEQGEGLWAEYTITNPQTGTESLKRSWIVLHDGYLFGAGYYP